MQNDKNFLGTAPIGKLLLKLSIPTVIAQLINMLYNVVDRIYIGHIPGEGSLALTGVGVCMPIIMIVTAFAALISSGGAPRASICMGKQDNKSAEQILGNCFSLQIVVSIVLTVVLLIWNKDLLMAFGASKNTLGYATDYMRIYALGTLFVQLTLGMNAFITAQGFTTTSMVSVLIGAICNITLDPVFIFVFNMGVKGAALATVLSQAISTIWVVVFLSGKKTQLHLRKKYMGLKPKIFLPCVALGLATFIMQASESVVTVCFNSSLLHYGGDIAVGAMTILTSVMQFAMLPLQGIAQGSQPIASYNYGAKNADRVKKTFRLLVITCLTYSTLLWAAVQIIPKVFVSIFTSDAKLVAFTAPMLKIYLGGLFLFGIQIACQITFTSLGKAVNSIIVAVVRKFVLLLPLIYIMPHVVSNPTIGVYMAEPIADIIAVLFTSVLFTFQFKKALAQIRNSNEM
ncbi:MATE family efflux transporter [Eubacterium ventriosum]|jgi:MATE efflux family protein|uniref:Multidrug export protein MepA n=1 Tax=Eubacterium ventriosum ATCC 27560 TaxID=411463 RepID=A5Z351_9FIRM|nr:MATE family efflux transporter [Eubacterium ventriosum]EDM52593.1 MATE efflux family protein [Eubacterium ventriosum ATCC 27560]UWP36264.1 MATE family efflux transporter [Eubacterium ventriosum]